MTVKKGLLQRSAAPKTETEAPPIVHEVLNSPGQPLDHETRSFLEPRFGFDLSAVPVKAPASRNALTVSPAGDPRERQADDMAERALRMPGPSTSFLSPFAVRADFSGVRIHDDPLAAESSRAVNAKAYTVGQDIVFGQGRYAPGTSAGQKLLAHELAHTIQQSQHGLQATASLQRTIGDGHDLTSPRFSLIEDLEAVFDDETKLVKRYQSWRPGCSASFVRPWVFSSSLRSRWALRSRDSEGRSSVPTGKSTSDCKR
jgi:hypothetical protein